MHRLLPHLRRQLLIVPLLAFVALLVIYPNATLAVTSLWTSVGGSTIHDFTLANFQKVLGEHLYITLVAKTLYTALGAALAAGCIAYPLAYIVSRYGGRYRAMIALLIVAPLWVSYLIRVFSWKIILGQTGVLNSVLTNLGILSEPYDKFLYSRFAVFLTLTYVGIPYVFITAFAALERVPRPILEASRDCGAGAVGTFLHVVWPLSRRGAAIGFALAFLIGVGDYITPSLVGGLQGTMVGSVIAAQFGIASNLPVGSALSVVTLACVFAILLVTAAVTRTRGVLE